MLRAALLLAIVAAVLGIRDRECDAETERGKDMNSYVLRAVENLAQTRAHLGYEHRAFFTQNLTYERPGDVLASPRHPHTMCVAAVTEVIIEALRLYAEEHPLSHVFKDLPSRTWNKGSLSDLRPYLFMWNGTHSRGTADALLHFGIGAHVPFTEAKPGDFVNLNRTNGTGHAVVFLGYLDAKGETLPQFDKERVAGFAYFSAQGKPNDGGLGYKAAYFAGRCPKDQDPSKLDCRVRFGETQAILNTGYLLDPERWTAEQAHDKAKGDARHKIAIGAFSAKHNRAPSDDEESVFSTLNLAKIEEYLAGDLARPLSGYDATTTMRFDGDTPTTDD